MPSVLIVDYGMSNLASIKRALEICGAETTVSDKPSMLGNTDKIILPGVGSFDEGMKNLRDKGLDAAIKNACKKGAFLLGICLGMQLLAGSGSEGRGSEGLDLIHGSVARMIPKSRNNRVPHVGWNNVVYSNKSQLFKDIPSSTDFYFVHSYHFVPIDSRVVLATTPHCGTIVSAIHEGNIFGIQFHPEKSSNHGLQLLNNFINL